MQLCLVAREAYLKTTIRFWFPFFVSLQLFVGKGILRLIAENYDEYASLVEVM